MDDAIVIIVMLYCDDFQMHRFVDLRITQDPNKQSCCIWRRIVSTVVVMRSRECCFHVIRRPPMQRQEMLIVKNVIQTSSRMKGKRHSNKRLFIV